MSDTDIVISLFLVFWGFYGFFRGFVSELVSLICWSSAIYVSANYFHIPTEFIDSYINANQISQLLAFVVIFVSTFIFSAVLGFTASKMVGILGLGLFNRFIGFFFGLLKGSVLVIIVVYILDLTEFRNNIIFQDSEYISFFDAIIKKHLVNTNSIFDDMGLDI